MKTAETPLIKPGILFKQSRPPLLPLADRIETITYDNGKEFASHAQIATSLGALSYFAKPYHSWERGLNEHTNGLFRQYFPKGSDLSILSDADVQRVEDKLNSRPRKILGYQTVRPHIRRKPGVAGRCGRLLGGKRVLGGVRFKLFGPQAVSRAPAARARQCAWPDRLRLLRLDQARQARRGRDRDVEGRAAIGDELRWTGPRRPPAILVHADAHSRYVGSSRSTTRPPRRLGTRRQRLLSTPIQQ